MESAQACLREVLASLPFVWFRCTTSNEEVSRCVHDFDEDDTERLVTAAMALLSQPDVQTMAFTFAEVDEKLDIDLTKENGKWIGTATMTCWDLDLDGYNPTEDPIIKHATHHVAFGGYIINLQKVCRAMRVLQP